MAVGFACLMECLTVPLDLLIYVLFETSIFTVIVIPSLVISHWITRAFLYVYFLSGRKVDDEYAASVAACSALHSTLSCWFVGVLALQWTKSWNHMFTPARLVRFQERRHPFLCGWLKTLAVSILLVICTCTQICTYIQKFNRPVGNAIQSPLNGDSLLVQMKKLIAKNDFKFMGSMLLLVYLSVRVFRYYRNTCKAKTEVELRDVVKRPPWRVYLEHYYSLLGYELFLMDVMILIILGLGVIFEIDNKVDHWFPYLFSSVVGAGFGILFGDVEERLGLYYYSPWLDNRVATVYPYYRTTHWNVRLHLLAFFLLPLINLNYFQDPTVEQFGDPKFQLLHNLLHLAFISNIWMYFAKGSALFSYVIRGHFWHIRPMREDHFYDYPNGRLNNGHGGVGGGRARSIHGCNNNRIAPQNPSNDVVTGGSLNEPSGGSAVPGEQEDFNAPNAVNVKSTRSGGVRKILKNILTDYFPVNITFKKEGAAGDQGSVSTGTCTSLLNRHNINESNTTVAAVAFEQDPPNSLRVTDLHLSESLPSEEFRLLISHDVPNLDALKDHVPLVEHQQVEAAVQKGNLNEAKQSIEAEEPASDDKDANIDSDTKKYNDKTKDLLLNNSSLVQEIEVPAPVKLKRCPPVLVLPEMTKDP